jgi:hypothetical protein
LQLVDRAQQDVEADPSGADHTRQLLNGHPSILGGRGCGKAVRASGSKQEEWRRSFGPPGGRWCCSASSASTLAGPLFVGSPPSLSAIPADL